MTRIALITINRAVATRRYGAIGIEIPKISAAMMVPAAVILHPISTRPTDVRFQFSIVIHLYRNGNAGRKIPLIIKAAAIAISNILVFWLTARDFLCQSLVRIYSEFYII
jgi:hypothetical protein